MGSIFCWDLPLLTQLGKVEIDKMQVVDEINNRLNCFNAKPAISPSCFVDMWLVLRLLNLFTLYEFSQFAGVNKFALAGWSAGMALPDKPGKRREYLQAAVQLSYRKLENETGR